MVRLLPELCCKRHCELSAMFRDLDVIRVQLLEEVEAINAELPFSAAGIPLGR